MKVVKTATELRADVSNYGALRTMLITKLKHGGGNNEDRHRLLQATIDLAETRVKQGNELLAQDLYEEIIELGLTLARDAEPSRLAAVLRLPREYLVRFFQGLVADRKEAYLALMPDRERERVLGILSPKKKTPKSA